MRARQAHPVHRHPGVAGDRLAARGPGLLLGHHPRSLRGALSGPLPLHPGPCREGAQGRQDGQAVDWRGRPRWRLHPHSEDPAASVRVLQRQGAVQVDQSGRSCRLRRRCSGGHPHWRGQQEGLRAAAVGRGAAEPWAGDGGWGDDDPHQAQHDHPHQEDPGLLHLRRQPAWSTHSGVRGRARPHQGQQPARQVRAERHPACATGHTAD
mmetsp:Transcript_10867/g.19027  ORF Transcript_10867/g.19027 Transcript_10867/m.19027 type:complete len:209 (-) Transcript_10867:950-1576(-)